MPISWGLVETGQGLESGACHKELEHKVENLKHMKLEVMQREIKNKYELPAC